VVASVKNDGGISNSVPPLVAPTSMPRNTISMASVTMNAFSRKRTTKKPLIQPITAPTATIATTIVFGLPLSVWLAAAAFAIAAFVLRYHRVGRALYAIGGNPEAARAAGIRVERITWGVFVLGSMLASLGGLIVTGYVGAINANQGNGMIFTVFAAAVIGGISLDGGKGTMLGALSGVLLLGVVQNLLTLAQVPSFWIQAIYGAIILGSLMVARLASGEGQN
jgi:simple sugar transport system permease protein